MNAHKMDPHQKASVVNGDESISLFFPLSCCPFAFKKLCSDTRINRLGLLSQLLLLRFELSLLLFSQVKKRLVLAGLQVVVVGANDTVGIINSNWPNVRKSLDLSGTFLVLSISHLNIELLSTRLNRVPTRQPRSEVDIAGHAEIGRVNDFVSAWVVEDGLGVNTGLVGESTEASDVVVERNVDLNGLRHKVLDLLELVELVLALDILRVRHHHTSHQTTKRGDSITLANTENGGINVSGTGLQSAVSVGNGTASVVVEVSLNVTLDDTPQDTNELVNLAGGCATDRVSNTNTVDTNLVNGRVDGEKVHQVRPEGVFTGESDFNALGLNEVDNFDSGVGNIGHVLAVRVLTEV